MAIDYTEQVEDVKNYYADLLIMQYRSQYKARETVKLGAELYLCDGLVFSIQDVLDIDTAKGNQLDLIGKILDCPRNVASMAKVDVDWFEFHKPEGSNGFSLPNQLSKGFFKDLSYDYNSSATYLLQDEDYRILLKFKAIANRAISSWGFLDRLFWDSFGNAVKITNNKDLSITYNIATSLLSDGLIAAIQLGYLISPIGTSYSFAYDDTHRFSINPTPSTAKVELTASGYTQQGNSIFVREGVTVNYKVSNYGYYSQSGTYTAGSEDYSQTITLEKQPTITINPTPSNAIVTLTSENNIQQGNSIAVNPGDTVYYKVELLNYSSKEGSIVATDVDQTIEVELSNFYKFTAYVANTPSIPSTVILTSEATEQRIEARNSATILAPPDSQVRIKVIPDSSLYEGLDTYQTLSINNSTNRIYLQGSHQVITMTFVNKINKELHIDIYDVGGKSTSIKSFTIPASKNTTAKLDARYNMVIKIRAQISGTATVTSSEVHDIKYANYIYAINSMSSTINYTATDELT